jgi:hypothetical protein
MAKKGGQKTTTTQALDPASQRYVDQMRYQAQDAANIAGQVGPQQMSIADQVSQFMNPYQGQVVNAVNSQFDQLRAGAGMQANQAATMAGAFGGSRHGVASGVRQGQLDQTQMGILAQLQAGGYQNAQAAALPYFEQQRMAPIQAQQARMGLLQQGVGPTGFTQTGIQPKGSAMGSAIGGAQVGSAFGPWGAAIGGGVGLLGGLFG